MTIAAGFPCSDGLVICADTQETIGNIGKLYVSKISTFRTQYITFGIAGAGDAAWIEMYLQQLWVDHLSSIGARNDNVGVANIIESFNNEFFQKYIAAYAPKPQDRPSIELLIGMRTNSSPSPANNLMVHISDNTLTWTATNYVSIGAGFLTMRYLADSLVKSSYTTRQTASLAVYMMDKVKTQVEGCGGPT